MKQWKPCKEIPTYELSEDGEVRNKKTGRVMRTSVNQKGYETVCLHDNNKQYTRKVHRLVAEAFSDNDNTGLLVTHADGNKLNNRADNLEWRSRSEIIRDTYANGRQQTHRMRRVRCVETGEVFDSIVECSKTLGISVHSISRSLNRRSRSTCDGYHFELI